MVARVGEKPASPDARDEILRSVVSRASKLIPLIGHRYVPEQPHEAGNPVFSVFHSDVIYYGANLADYFEREFMGWNYRPWPDQVKHIPFFGLILYSDLPQARTEACKRRVRVTRETVPHIASRVTPPSPPTPPGSASPA